ncbi:MAG: MFS transporter, partial [archaeon]|nr:MFS transporter [archaeon]
MGRWVFDFYDLMLFTYLTAALQKDLGLTPAMISLCIGISLLATAIGGIIFGAIGDRYGRKKALQWTIIIYSIGAFLCGLSWSFGSLVIFRIITGLGVGGEWTTGQTYINETFPDDLRARYGGLMQSGAPVGIILAAIVGNLISPIIGWRFAFMLSIIPALMVIIIRRHLNESDVWLQDKANNVKKSTIEQFKQLISKKHCKYFIISLVLCTFGMAAYWYTYTWLPTYLSSERGLTILASTIGIIIMQCGDLVGYTSFGFVS